MTFYSTPPYHGTLRRYHAHPAAWLHLLPETMTFEEGSLLEPLSVALAGIDRSNLRLGDPVVICGAGPIGLISLLAAHAAGAAPIVITDMDESRLQRAREYVPRVKTVLVEKNRTAKDVGKSIINSLGTKAKLSLECTGVESSIHAAIYVSNNLHYADEIPADSPHVGLSVWRQRVRNWSWQRLSEHPLHAPFSERNRLTLSIPIPRHLSKSNYSGVRRVNRSQATCDTSIPA